MPEAVEAAPTKKSRSVGGRKKAAMMLVALGPERAAKICGQLDDHQIEALSIEMAKMRQLDPEVTEEVFEEAVEMAVAADYIGQGGLDYAREVLEKSMGAEKSQELIRKLAAAVETR